MLKESSIGSGWDDGVIMKELSVIDSFIATMWVAAICLAIILSSYNPKLDKLQEEKTALEIKVLQHELKAYEEMDRQLSE